MPTWVKVLSVSEVPAGTCQVVDLEGTEIAVCHVAGQFYAVENICTHDGGELTGGRLDGCQIVCPRHGARFDLRSGAVLSPPAYEPIHAFPLRVVDGVIQLQDDRDPS